MLISVLCSASAGCVHGNCEGSCCVHGHCEGLVTVPLSSAVSTGDRLLVDGLSCQEVSESVDVALSLAEQESVDVFARYLRSPGGVLPDGSVAAPFARSRRSRGRSRIQASSRQVAAGSTRWCSRGSPGGVLEVVQGCTGSCEAQLPVLSDAVAPAVVVPTAGADSCAGTPAHAILSGFSPLTGGSVKGMGRRASPHREGRLGPCLTMILKLFLPIMA